MSPNPEPWPVSDDVVKNNPELAEQGLIAAPAGSELRDFLRRAQVVQAEVDRILEKHAAEPKPKAPKTQRAGRKGGFKSKLDERAYLAAEAVFAQAADYQGMTCKVRYEPIALTLHAEGRPLRSYRPDLMITFVDETGRVLNKPWLIEVKPRYNPKAGQGGKAGPNWRAHKSGRSSKLNLDHAAAEYGDCFRFFVMWPSKASKTGFDFIEVKADEPTK